MRFVETLWDLLLSSTSTTARRPKRSRPRAGRRLGAQPPQRSVTPMQRRYDDLVERMKHAYGIRVVKWRSSTSGCAWMVYGDDGSVGRLIESPYPRGPMSCAVFMHEVGHHAIGFRTFKPRCLEEYHAWRWAIDSMQAEGFNVTKGVLERRDRALQYAVSKALRRGLKRLPVELQPYVPSRWSMPA